jgi:processing peptidase subunit alpha
LGDVSAEPVVYHRYIGGERRLEVNDTDLSSVAVAFEVGGWHDDDLVPVCVLHTLLGGGDAFSAGGPGKGMYSRLYRVRDCE